jgi:hypothetical protein
MSLGDVSLDLRCPPAFNSGSIDGWGRDFSNSGFVSRSAHTFGGSHEHDFDLPHYVASTYTWRWNNRKRSIRRISVQDRGLKLALE